MTLEEAEKIVIEFFTMLNLSKQDAHLIPHEFHVAKQIVGHAECQILYNKIVKGKSHD